MHRIQREAIVPYTPVQMFDLVNAIERYPEFLSWCAESTVHSRNEHEVQASLVIAAAGMKQSFTTRNTLEQGTSIDMQLIDGPFDELQGRWQFIPQEEGGCRVTLDLQFVFSNHLLGMTFGALFGKVADKLVDAFCQRAATIYGTNAD